VPYGLGAKAVVKNDKKSENAVTQDQSEVIPITRRASSGVATNFDGKLDVILMRSVEASS
jgi:hypothetical protein